MKRKMAAIIAGAASLLWAVTVAGRQVVVAPKETDEILANPGVGWETFYQTSKQDKQLPSWIPSTIHYVRWGWDQLEPEPGKLNTEFLDQALKETRESGQTLAFRVMCCSTEPGHAYHPKWLAKIGGREIETRYDGNGPYLVPDLDNSVVFKKHVDFIKRLGKKYDGHPTIDHVDLGSVGWWGEWHMSGGGVAKMPRPQTQKKIVDAYLAAFKKTPLVMVIGDGEHLKYACAHGTSWRADCLGDMGGFSQTWNHMRNDYPTKIAQVRDAWKNAPVAWETCWDMRKWVDEGWSLRYIFNYALACHASVINNKSSPLPQRNDVRPETERFLRRLGYRLILKELKHPAQAGERLDLAMKWQNTGSAPCYKPYRVAYRLTNDNGFSKVIVGNVAVNKWLPGSIALFTPEFFKMPNDLPNGRIHDVSDSVALGDVPNGQYTLSIGIVNTSSAPVVRLGIEGRAGDGWYPLSKIKVVK